jgi:hypothetical protein
MSSPDAYSIFNTSGSAIVNNGGNFLLGIFNFEEISFAR